MGFKRSKIDSYGNVQPECYARVGKITVDYLEEVLIVEVHEYSSPSARTARKRYHDSHIVVTGKKFRRLTDEIDLTKKGNSLLRAAEDLVLKKFGEEEVGNPVTVIDDPAPEPEPDPEPEIEGE